MNISLPSVEELTVTKSTVLQEFSTTQKKRFSTVQEVLYSFKQVFPVTRFMVTSIAMLAGSTAPSEFIFSTLSHIDEPSCRNISLK